MALTPDERAYELLQWQALAPLQSFDEEECYPYAEIQRKRSDAAFDAWEKEHPYQTSSELVAFRELERLGVFTQSDYYSPSKASNGDYSKRLKEHVQLRDRREAGGQQKHRRVTPARRYRR